MKTTDRVTEIQKRCVYFNGTQHDKCEAGVEYHALFGTGLGCFKHICCLSDPESPAQCLVAKYPTREEAEVKYAQWEERIELTTMVVNKAHGHAKSKGLGVGHGGRGEMPCPTGCGGTLRYSVAGVNGHMHAACSTPDCVSWMQ